MILSVAQFLCKLHPLAVNLNLPVKTGPG